ncbi:MAG: hypothetical protein DRG09_02295 [Epsilonproteobacteria bacterium]|nr:MAG: hypothetical protein DRG09_02295 [Campylobacterota bacterium]
MQLNDILEENSVKAISDKTMISEENLEYLFASEFDALSKVKTLGFISILEREYSADLSAVKTQSLEHYGQSRESNLFPIGQPIMDEDRGRPTGLIIFIFLLLGVSSWYFFTQFDKKNLNDLIPFMHEKTIGSSMSSDENAVNALKISEKTIEKNVVTSATESMNTQKDNKSEASATISFNSVNSIDNMKTRAKAQYSEALNAES